MTGDGRRKVYALWLAGAVAVTGVLAFGGGHRVGRVAARKPPEFHDLRVTHAPEYVKLVEPRHPAVRSAARSLGSLQSAYSFVRDEIVYDPSAGAVPASATLRDRRGSCIGKAVLLCSLYRSLGLSAGQVRVVTGEIRLGERTVDHAWVDLEQDGTCLQQDPSELLGYFDYGDFRGRAYSKWYVSQENFCFNDAGLAIVSRLNRLLD